LDPKQKVDAVRDIGKFKFLQSEEYLDLWPEVARKGRDERGVRRERYRRGPRHVLGARAQGPLPPILPEEVH